MFFWGWFMLTLLFLLTSGSWIGFVLAGCSMIAGAWHFQVETDRRALLALLSNSSNELLTELLRRLAQKLEQAYEENIQLQLMGTVPRSAHEEISDPERRLNALRISEAERLVWRMKQQKRINRDIKSAKTDFWHAVEILWAHYNFAKPKSYKELLPPKDAVPAYDPD